MKQSDDIYQLALRARDGDRDALTHLVDAVRMRLLTRAYAVTGNYADAQDAVAGTIVEVCRHIGRLREPRGIMAWMQRIVQREAVRLSRKPSMAELSGDESDTQQDVFRSILQIDVERALTTLPTNHAMALQLFYWNDLSLQEVALEMSTQSLAVNVGQVKVWLHRGRQQLARNMKGYEEMKTTQKTAPVARRAGLFCSNLSDAMIATVTDAMRAGGFTPDVITDKQIPGLIVTDSARVPSIWTRDHIAQSQALTRMLKKYDALVFDEQIGTRSGLEYGLFCKSTPDTVHIPITLLHSQPADAVFIQACGTVGFAHLIDKSNLEAMAAAFRPAEGSNIWQHFSEDARQTVYFCQEEANQAGQTEIGSPHLLLGLIGERDGLAGKVLASLGVDLEKTRTFVSQIVTG